MVSNWRFGEENELYPTETTPYQMSTEEHNMKKKLSFSVTRLCIFIALTIVTFYVVSTGTNTGSKHRSPMKELEGLIKSTDSNSKLPLPLCIPTNTCPYDESYRPSCKDKANIPPFLPKVNETRLVHDLLQFFHGRRIAIIGDSLSRQWFEMLSCRLGLTEHWYESGKQEPKALLEAKKAGVTVEGLSNAPEYMRTQGKKALGYAMATTNNTITDSSARCKPLQTNLEYYHQDTPDASFSLLNFVSNHSDVLFVNVGHHNANAKRYRKIIESVMKNCSAINGNTSELRGKKKENKCYFHETTPQHFQVVGQSNYSGLYHGPDGDFTMKDSCGPTSGETHPRNVDANKFAEKYNVPVVRYELMLKDAWRWHVRNIFGNLDCTHFCQDNEVWDLFHDGLIKAVKGK